MVWSSLKYCRPKGGDDGTYSIVTHVAFRTRHAPYEGSHRLIWTLIVIQLRLPAYPVDEIEIIPQPAGLLPFRLHWSSATTAQLFKLMQWQGRN